MHEKTCTHECATFVDFVHLLQCDLLDRVNISSPVLIVFLWWFLFLYMFYRFLWSIVLQKLKDFVLLVLGFPSTQHFTCKHLYLHGK